MICLSVDQTQPYLSQWPEIFSNAAQLLCLFLFCFANKYNRLGRQLRQSQQRVYFAPGICVWEVSVSVFISTDLFQIIGIKKSLDKLRVNFWDKPNVQFQRNDAAWRHDPENEFHQ